MKIIDKILSVFHKNNTSEPQINRTVDAPRPDNSSIDSLRPDISATDLHGRFGSVPEWIPGDVYDPSPRSEELPCKSVAEYEVHDPYKPEEERSQFERKLDAAKHPRRRRHHIKKAPKSTFVRPTSYFDSMLMELSYVPDVPLARESPFLGRKEAYQAFCASLDLTRAGIMLTGCAAADVVVAVGRKLHAKAEREKHEAVLAKRRKYYATENARRQAASAEIKAAIPRPENPRPTPEQLLEAYRHRHDDEAATLYFGRLMIDLEEHERFSPQIVGNKITGISGGVREWLRIYCPELADHYHTCQRFKRKVQLKS